MTPDNPPGPDKAPGPEGAPQPLTDSGSRPPGLHHTLPSSKTTSSGRVTVTLASVAKMAQTSPPPATGDAPAQDFPSLPSSKAEGFILPAKETPATLQQRLPMTSSGRVGATTSRTGEVKLPPKTAALPKLAGRMEGTPPPLPGKKKRLLPSFNFKSLSRGFLRSEDSIFADPNKTPEKKPEKIEAKAPEKAAGPKSDHLQSLEDFSRSKDSIPPIKPATPPPVAEVREPVPSPVSEIKPITPPPVARVEEFAPLPIIKAKEPTPSPIVETKPTPAPVTRVEEFAPLPIAKAKEPILPPVVEIKPTPTPMTRVEEFAPLPIIKAKEPAPPPVVEAKKPALPPPLPPPKAPVLHAPPVEQTPGPFAVAPPMTDSSVQAPGDKHLLPPPVHAEETFPALAKAPALAESPRMAAPPLKVGAPLNDPPAVEIKPVVEAKAPVLPPPLPVVPPVKKESPVRTLKPAFPEEEKTPEPSPSIPPAQKGIATQILKPAFPEEEKSPTAVPFPEPAVIVAPVALAAAALVESLPPQPPPPAIEPAPPEIASAKAPEPAVIFPPAVPPSKMRLDPPRKSRLPKAPETPPEKLPEPKIDAPVVVSPPRPFASTVLPERLRNVPPKEPASPLVEEQALTPPPAVPAVPLPVETSPVSKQPKELPLPIPALTLPGVAPAAVKVNLDDGKAVPPVRSARARKRRLIGTIVFYVFFAAILPLLYFLGLHYGSETRVEGQVIPPPGTTLNTEVWIVSGDQLTQLAGSVADDLANDRAPKLQEIQERQDHVQRAQADIAAREERVRLLQEQVQAAKDEINSVIKDANDASQKIWDGPGAQIENEYNTRLDQLQAAIAARAKSLGLNYQPDNTYRSPDVWANAYRLALYQTPPGVDNVKEHQWIEDQLKQWRDYTKTLDERQKALRDQAAQIKLSPAPKVTDLNSQIEDLQHRIDSTVSEEDPIKLELQQAQTDLADAQSAEAGLDAKYYQELYALPESLISTRLPLRPNGRFEWAEMERDSAFAEGEQAHNYWIFARAIRPDGRQYWALSRFTITKHSTFLMVIEPDSFISTKSILRPDLPPDEQTQ